MVSFSGVTFVLDNSHAEQLNKNIGRTRAVLVH